MLPMVGGVAFGGEGAGGGEGILQSHNPAPIQRCTICKAKHVCASRDDLELWSNITAFGAPLPHIH